MVDKISKSPQEFARDLFRENLISRDTLLTVRLPGDTPLVTARFLFTAIKGLFLLYSAEDTLRKLCAVMSQHENMKDLSQKMLESYGKLSNHSIDFICYKNICYNCM